MSGELNAPDLKMTRSRRKQSERNRYRVALKPAKKFEKKWTRITITFGEITGERTERKIIVRITRKKWQQWTPPGILRQRRRRTRGDQRGSTETILLIDTTTSRVTGNRRGFRTVYVRCVWHHSTPTGFTLFGTPCVSFPDLKGFCYAPDEENKQVVRGRTNGTVSISNFAPVVRQFSSRLNPPHTTVHENNIRTNGKPSLRSSFRSRYRKYRTRIYIYIIRCATDVHTKRKDGDMKKFAIWRDLRRCLYVFYHMHIKLFRGTYLTLGRHCALFAVVLCIGTFRDSDVNNNGQ